MDFIEIIYKNLLYSLYGLFDFDLWRNFVINYLITFPIILSSVFIIGFFASIKIDTNSSFCYWVKEKLSIFIIICLTCIVGSCFMLYFSKMNTYFFTLFTIFSFLFLLFTGSKLSFVIRGNRWAQIYLFLILALLIGSYIISVAPSSNKVSDKTAKQRLKDTFKGISGRDADAEEKKGFWKSTVGEEKPSESKKDDYWEGNK